MENEEALRQYVKAHGEIPSGAGKLVLGLFDYRPSKYSSPTMIDTAVRRGAIRMADVVAWLGEHQTCNQAIDLIEMWPSDPAGQAAAVAALCKLLEQLLTDYRADFEGVHGKCGRVMDLLKKLPRCDTDNASIKRLLWAALKTERRRDDRNHWFAQPLMTWLVELGDADAFQIEDVEPWEGMLIHWKANGYSWNDLVIGLTQAGAIDPVSAEDQSKWLARESEHPGYMFIEIPGAYGNRIACAMGLREENQYDKLFIELGRVLRPSVAIHATYNENYLLQYKCEGTEYSFQLDLGGYREDTVALGREFNDLMRKLGRSERAFQMIEATNWEAGELVVFFCADKQRFLTVKEKLRLPFFYHADDCIHD